MSKQDGPGIMKGITPLPWELNKRSSMSVTGPNDRGVAACGAYQTNTVDPDTLTAQHEANARYIVTCCNRMPEVMKALQECADDLAAELEERYPQDVRIYPGQQARYERDMVPVQCARALLSKLREELSCTTPSE